MTHPPFDPDKTTVLRPTPQRPSPPLRPPPPLIQASNIPPVLVAPSAYHPVPQPPGQPKPTRRRGIWIAAGTAVALLAAGGSIGGVAWHRQSETEAQLAQIRQTVTEFAEASDSADTPTMASLMCAAEAAEFTDQSDYDPDAEPITPAPARPSTSVRSRWPRTRRPSTSPVRRRPPPRSRSNVRATPGNCAIRAGIDALGKTAPRSSQPLYPLQNPALQSLWRAHRDDDEADLPWRGGRWRGRRCRIGRRDRRRVRRIGL